jgi:hypothetical protein
MIDNSEYCYKLKGKASINNFKNLKFVEIDEKGDKELIESFRSAGVQIFQDKE